MGCFFLGITIALLAVLGFRSAKGSDKGIGPAVMYGIIQDHFGDLGIQRARKTYEYIPEQPSISAHR